MMSHFRLLALPLVLWPGLLPVAETSAEVKGPGAAQLSGLHGGLIVQLGGEDVQDAITLSRTGRYLVHVLDQDVDIVQAARTRIRDAGRYGLAWAEHARDADRLPYAENVVNVISVNGYSVPVAEMRRVLVPGGTVVVSVPDIMTRSQFEEEGLELISSSESHLLVRKPWPAEMDVWSHPRHAADGNAVSLDSLVGPPERVRWIAAATSEVEGMVTAGGRNFYGGILARDSFNGLRPLAS